MFLRLCVRSNWSILIGESQNVETSRGGAVVSL